MDVSTFDNMNPVAAPMTMAGIRSGPSQLVVTPGIIRASSQDSNISKDIPFSESVKVLVDDVIRDLKSNDTKNTQLHLSILNQQLSLENLTSLESVKVLMSIVI
jgi:hypothetical protein